MTLITGAPILPLFLAVHFSDPSSGSGVGVCHMEEAVDEPLEAVEEEGV